MQRALTRHDMVGSIGQVGSAADNAAMESFFSLLQRNVLGRHRWATRDELRIAIVTWIERTYHRRRRQAPARPIDPHRMGNNHDQHRRLRGITELSPIRAAAPDAGLRVCVEDSDGQVWRTGPRQGSGRDRLQPQHDFVIECWKDVATRTMKVAEHLRPRVGAVTMCRRSTAKFHYAGRASASELWCGSTSSGRGRSAREFLKRLNVSLLDPEDRLLSAEQHQPTALALNVVDVVVCFTKRLDCHRRRPCGTSSCQFPSHATVRAVALVRGPPARRVSVGPSG
jgi:hypothetical protein